MTIGLFFGSFNPIHIGHLIIANHIVECTDLQQVWFVVTPHNPFKKKATLLDDYQRLEMVFLATQDYDTLKPSDIEFGMPQPNYTVNTLTHLQEKYPKYQFALIMGADNLASFHKWKNYKQILTHHQIYVYPRIVNDANNVNDFNNHPHIVEVNAPIMEISSTYIRASIKSGKQVKPLLPEKTWKYLNEMNFYR